MAGMGGYVFGEKDGKPNANDIGLNNSGAVQGAEYIQKWYKEKLFPKGIIGESGGSAADGLFNEGKAASIMNASMGIPSDGKGWNRLWCCSNAEITKWSTDENVRWCKRMACNKLL